MSTFLSTKMNLLISTIFAVVAFTLNSEQQKMDTSVITGYHFHTYFFQNSEDSINEAMAFRDKIEEIQPTQFASCRLNPTNYGPVGPHVIGSFQTCCNASALSAAQSFFMQNHGNLSVLLHPLTRYAVLDHTARAMWLGKDMPLDLSVLHHDTGEALKCSTTHDFD